MEESSSPADLLDGRACKKAEFHTDVSLPSSVSQTDPEFQSFGYRGAGWTQPRGSQLD